ncbi:MFS transporter [Acidithiobacillus sp. AMEEHan]|uniref:MFS transporter n=1 Tax=Acidithiobacillus sp. AMEEHan TaxID=2994951 RepID=UPI0027E4FEF9|nr:MFS transporter [Acidithiobacillus sp. AMEEHan]
MATERPEAGILLRYAPLGLPLAFAALPVYLLLPHLYATRFGLSLAGIGVLLLLARLGDAVIDPLIGRASDHWAAHSGSRLGLIWMGLPPLILSFYFLFNPIAKISVWWTLIPALFAFYLAYSLSSLNYQALGAELSTDYQGRSWLTTAREAGALLGVLLAAALPELLQKRLGPATAWPIFAGIFAALLLLAALPLRGRRLRRSVAATRQGPWWRFYEPLQRPHTARLLGVYTLSQSANTVAATLFFFFVDQILRAPSWAPAFLLLYFLAGAAGMPFWLWLSHRRGKAQAWRWAMVLATTAFLGAGFLGPDLLWGYALVCLVSGLALGADQALPPSILADHTDNDVEARAGSYFGLYNWVGKAATALGAGLILPLLQLLGYSASGQNLWALLLGYAVVPALLKICSIYWLQPRRVEFFPATVPQGVYR